MKSAPFITPATAAAAASLALIMLSPAATAVVYDLQVPDVVNSTPDCTTGNLCDVENVPRIFCPAGQIVQSVTVSLLEAQMITSLSANNNTGSDACYNAIDVDHQVLTLTIDEPNAPALINGLGNSDGSDGTIASFGGCNSGFTSPPFRFFVSSGMSVIEPSILTTQKNAVAINSITYLPGDPGFDTFYGNGGTFRVTLQASANLLQEGPATFIDAVQTDATGSIEITAQCGSTPPPPPPVPAMGPLGLGALTVGLLGLGGLFGFRRKG
jgi:hypothetical protein